MARKSQKRDKRIQQSFTTTPIINEGFLIPLSPFYLFFRKEYATLMGQKLPDDQLDQILQKEEIETTGNVSGFYFFFGLCSTIYGSWTWLEDDEQAPYIHDYEKLMTHFDKQKKKCLTSIATIAQPITSGTINSESIVKATNEVGKKYRVGSLIYDEFYTVCEFLNAPSMVNLAQTCKHFAGHFGTLLSNLLNSDNQASFIEYFRKKKIDPRLTLLLHDNDTSLTPQLKEFKDSLDIRLVIDFKALNRQPGGNTDDFITRQVVLLKSNICKIYKSNIRNYDDTLYDNDIIIPIKNQNPNQAKEVIVSVCRVIAECERTPSPLIIKPKLNPQYLFTSHEQTEYHDSPEDFSQIEISVFNNSEKFFDFAKLSVILKEFDIIPYQMSKSAIELVEKSSQFCNASINNDDTAGEFQNNCSINILARKQKRFGRPGGVRVNVSTGQVEKMENFDEDSSSEEDDEEESDGIDLELENEKLWRKFDKKLSSNSPKRMELALE